MIAFMDQSQKRGMGSAIPLPCRDANSTALKARGAFLQEGGGALQEILCLGNFL